MLNKLSLEFRVALKRLGVDVLRRGVRSSALFSNFYLYESEGVVREKCQDVSILLPACTSMSAAIFFDAQ